MARKIQLPRSNIPKRAPKRPTARFLYIQRETGPRLVYSRYLAMLEGSSYLAMIEDSSRLSRIVTEV